MTQYKEIGKITGPRLINDDYEAYSVLRSAQTTKSDIGRSKSMKPVGHSRYVESEVRYKKRNYFGDAKNSVRIETLGFGTDFLEFNVEPSDLLNNSRKGESAANLSQRYNKVDFSGLNDLNFDTNRAGNATTNLKDQRAKLGLSDSNPKPFETFTVGKNIKPPAQKKKPVEREESLLDL